MTSCTNGVGLGVHLIGQSFHYRFVVDGMGPDVTDDLVHY